MLGKMIKNEFLEGIRSYVYVLIGGLVASLLVGYSFYQSNGFMEEAISSQRAFFHVLLPLGFGIILIFILMFAFFFQIVVNFKRDLFTDSRLLKFSLPVSSGQFYWAKIISVLLSAGLLLILLGTFNLLQYKIYLEDIIKSNPNWSLMSLAGSQFTTPKYLLFIASNFFLENLSSLTLAYFSIILVKTFFKNSKSGNSWFIVFLIISFIISLLSGAALIGLDTLVEFNPATNSLALVKPASDQLIMDLTTNIDSTVQVPLVNYFISSFSIIIFSFLSIFFLKNKVDY